MRLLREWTADNLAAAIIRMWRWPKLGPKLGPKLRLWLVLAVAMPVAAQAQSAAQAPSFEWRAEGSFPLQYTETSTATSNTRAMNMIPYLGVTGTLQLEPDLSAFVFANGGHGRLGSFLETDNTFASVGSGVTRRWGAFAAGYSFEHIHYFNGAFAGETNVANDVNLFASYRWSPNHGLIIRPSAVVTMRLDDMIAVQRYSAGARIDIEQQLSGPWWFFVSPRIRQLHYVGSESGRSDTRLAVVTGLRYAINESLSVRTLAGWESRTSTVASRAADRFTIGASLDFDIDFAQTRWPAGR